jgi:hypothetical protein
MPRPPFLLRDQRRAHHTEAIHLDPRYAAAFFNRDVAWPNKKDHDQSIAWVPSVLPTCSSSFLFPGSSKNLVKAAKE